MAGLPATVAVVPHERFSAARASLSSVLEHTASEVPIVYLDAGSPPLVRQLLEQRAARSEIQLLSTERFVSPNEARNLALDRVTTKYVAFVDNDMIVSPGWLEALVQCAEQTGAWIVGSVCCQTHGAERRIVAAGGTAELIDLVGRRTFQEHDELAGQYYDRQAVALRRQMVGQVGLQATLVRVEAFERLGPLDEALLSGGQHTDLCLAIRELGQSVVLETACVVQQAPLGEFQLGDLEYFRLRWSDAWNRATLARLAEKWRLPHDDPGLLALGGQLDMRRRLPLEPYRRILRILGRAPAQWIERVVIAPFEQVASRRQVPPLSVVGGKLRPAA